MSILETIRQPKQRKLLMSAGLSWMFDAMDVGMLSFIIADLSLKWQLSPEQTGLFTSINSIGMVFGAAIAGYMADKYGRKSVLLWTLLIFSFATGLSAAATGFVVLCILRFIAGFGLGGNCPLRRRWCRNRFSLRIGEGGRAAGELLGGRLDCFGIDRLFRDSEIRLASGLYYRRAASAICPIFAQGNRGSAEIYEANGREGKPGSVFSPEVQVRVGQASSPCDDHAVGALVYRRIFLLRYVPVASIGYDA